MHIATLKLFGTGFTREHSSPNSKLSWRAVNCRPESILFLAVTKYRTQIEENACHALTNGNEYDEQKEKE